MALEPFQSATARAVINALERPNGSKRFLIADEVGLGKTVVSRALAKHLGEGRRTPLNVVYLCSNLNIADQNLKKLLSLDPTWATPEDRLSLVRLAPPDDKKAGFRVFSFTPDTSLPGWKRTNRTGRAAERDLIADLLTEIAPRVLAKLNELDRRRQVGKASGKYRPLWSAGARTTRAHLEVTFAGALRDVFNLRGKPLERGLLAWLANNEDPLEFVLRARSALSLGALRDRTTRPDLLILDEFHRYADLITPAEGSPAGGVERERLKVHQLLVGELLRAGLPIVLLSATPYRLSRADGGTIVGSSYNHLQRLIRFLYADNNRAAQEAIDRLGSYLSALQSETERGAAIAEVRMRKLDLEESLRPIMSRTERATSLTGELFEKVSLHPSLRHDDLRVFRHFATVVNKVVPRMHSWVQPLWASVPYPAETMFDYIVARALNGSQPPTTSRAQINGPAHPLLRSLYQPFIQAEDGLTSPPLIDNEVLRLPWLPPTQPWWALSGAWSGTSERRAGKTLLFSRYTGTPPAVSALISQAVAPTPRAKGRASPPRGHLKLDNETPGPLVSMFIPWPALAAAVGTERKVGQTIAAARRQARSSFRAWARANGVAIDEAGKGARKTWQLAFGLELKVGGAPGLARLMPNRSALRTAYDALKAKSPQVAWVSGKEADALADFLLSAPGAVVARSALRHDPDIRGVAKTQKRLMSFCWDQLRPYFAARHFADTLRRSAPRRRSKAAYPDLLRKAVVDGGLEAALDEHLAVMSLIGDGGVVDHLAASLVSAGHVRMRRKGGAQQTPVHAAMPFNGAKRKSGTKEGKATSNEHRSDAIRGAFNSPFWPHVLCTTSVGQEGLDFHVWCDRVIHWDLPRDPVDFEQREGRIARYGGLCVRRAIVRDFPDAASLAAAGESPFAAVLDQARLAPKDEMGIARWWCPPTDKPRRVTFVTPFSQSGARLAALQDDLMRYRLGLGQPDPEQFGFFVKHFDLGEKDVRTLALDLSAWSHASSPHCRPTASPPGSS